MKKVNFLFAAMLLAGASVTAQTYTAKNHVNYDFKSGDAEYNLYDQTAQDNSTMGWQNSWDFKGKTEWDTEQLIISEPQSMNDNGFSANMFKATTPTIKYNLKAYPYLLVKFNHMPVCGEGGWQDNDPNKEYMFGTTRLHVIERAATSPNGANCDYWYFIDPDGEGGTTVQEQSNYLTYVMSYNDDGDEFTGYLFELRSGTPRNHASISMSTGEEAALDLVLISCDVQSATDKLAVEFIKSFTDIDAAQDYMDGRYATPTSVQNNKLNAIKVISDNGKIIINNACSKVLLEIYDITGAFIAKTNESEIAVPAGKYIVRVITDEGVKTVKVLNK